MSAWFVVVLELTTLSRAANITGQVNFSLFSGYVSVWNQWSYTELQMIIFNMLMFAPLGFLLPFLTSKGCKFPFVCIVSLAVTLLTELLQLFTGRVIFELDDLLHNFAGSMFEYFVAMFVMECVADKKPAKGTVLRMLAIPPVYVVGISAAVIACQAQEYGNWAFVPGERQNMDIVSVESSVHFSDDTEPLAVYRNAIANDSVNARRLGESLAAFCGTELKDVEREGQPDFPDK